MFDLERCTDWNKENVEDYKFIDDLELPLGDYVDELKYFLDKVVVRRKEFLGFLEWVSKYTYYFQSPASVKYHESRKHGLLYHSMNVCRNLLVLNKILAGGFYPEESCVIVSLCHDCLPEGTMVSTSIGDVRIEKLKVGDEVVVLEKKHKISNVWYTGEKECLRVKTKYGYSLETSKDHRFLLANGEFKRADELVVGDLVVLDKGGFGEKYEDLAYLMGYVLGDGWLSGSDNSINVKVMVDDLDSKIKRVFLNLGGRVYRNTNPGSPKEMCKLYVNDLSLRKKLESYGMTPCGALNKKIPDVVWTWDALSVRLFLQGLFDSDGSVALKNDGSYLNVNYASVSEDIVLGIQRLLKKFDIRSKTFILREAMDGKAPRGDGFVHRKRIYGLVIEGSYNIQRFVKYVGFSLERKMNRLLEFKYFGDGGLVYGIEDILFKNWSNLNESMKKRLSSKKPPTYKSVESFLCLLNQKDQKKVEWCYRNVVPIESVESVGVRKCYDIEVDDVHAFVANGFVVHNCGKAGYPDLKGNRQTQYLPNKPTSKQAQYGYVPNTMWKFNQLIPFLDVPDASVYWLLYNGVKLTAEEFQAIRDHDGAYVEANRVYSSKETPLTSLLQYSDNWAGFHQESVVMVNDDSKGYHLEKQVKR